MKIAKKKPDLNVNGTIVRVIAINGTDFLCISDIALLKNPVEPKDVVKNWMRTRSTISFLGLWEKLNNPDFKGVEFDPLLKVAGDNAFTMSPTRWVDEFNVALFGQTHQQWQAANPSLKGNQRDYADINQLICLSNMENLNAVMIEDGIPPPQRLKRLNEIAIHQMRILSSAASDRRLLKA